MAKVRTVIVTLEVETAAPLRTLASRRAWLLVGAGGGFVRQARAQVAQPPKAAKTRSQRKR